MSKRRFTIRVDSIILALILLVGAWLRFRDLGIMPLNNSEALSALTAAEGTPAASEFWESTNGKAASPLYAFLTWILFMLFPGLDAVPRIIPAAAGLLLVYMPWLTRERIGSRSSLLTSLLFAVSPLMVSISRTATGAMLSAAAGAGLVTALWRIRMEPAPSNRRRKWAPIAAIAAAAFLSSGIESITAIIIAGIVLYFMSIVSSDISIKGYWSEFERWFKEAGYIILAALLIIITGAGFRISGSIEFFNSIGEWFGGWRGQAVYGPLAGIASIWIYEPAVLPGLAALILSIIRRKNTDLLLLFLLVSSSLVHFLYPARSETGLIWSVLFLNLLAVYGICVVLDWLHAEPRETINIEIVGGSVVLLTLMIFAYLQAGAYVHHATAADMTEAVARIGIAVGAVVTCIAVLILFGLGWGWKFTVQSGGIALAVLLLFSTVSSIWHLNFLPSAATASEIWRDNVTRHEIRSFVDSAENISIANTGKRAGLKVYFNNTAPPALAWHLREFPAYNASEGERMEDPGPGLILTPSQEIPVSLPSAYTGRTGSLFESKGWLTAFPPDFLRWWYIRQSPVYYDDWTLLVRSDLMFVEIESESELGNIDTGEGTE